jgi:hypothetical protein
MKFNNDADNYNDENNVKNNNKFILLLCLQKAVAYYGKALQYTINSKINKKKKITN